MKPLSKLLASACALTVMHGCTTTTRMVQLTMLQTAPCAAAANVTWAGPRATDAAQDRARLSAWCESVGPALIENNGASSGDVSRDGLIIATWNIHEGGGDLERFVRYVQTSKSADAATRPIVILLQEVARAGELVPKTIPSTVRPPGRIRPGRTPSFDIAAVAKRLNMSLAYIPSMRNGEGAISNGAEDRGSAILSTLPLSEIVGIELPWVSQRRVAVMATVLAQRNGAPWRMRIVSVHLDNRPGRSAQAAALARFTKALASDDAPVVVGGDLNTWFGTAEPAVRQLDAAISRIESCGHRATFRFGLRLDHLFTTLPREVLGRCEIADDFFGSDHRPTILTLR